MQTVAVSMAESFDMPGSRAAQGAPFDKLRTERVRLGLDVDHLLADGALLLRVDPVAASKSN